MTIQLNKPSTSVAEATRATEAIVGIDLTLLGAARTHGERARGTDIPVEHMSFPTLASAVMAAAQGGIDFVSLSEGFVTRSDHSDVTGALDAAKTCGRLIEHADLALAAEVPCSADGFDRAIELMNRQGPGFSCVEFAVDEGADYELLADSARRAHARGTTVAARIDAARCDVLDLQAIASWADAVRLLSSDPHEAREVRFALRSAAAEQGRELKVLCEIAFIVSASREAAKEREILLRMLGADTLHEGKARVVGIVADVVDEVERWISAGATDGIVFVPASVPTDLASLIRGILPLMRARHA